MSGSKIAFGEPSGSNSRRLSDIVNVFQHAGFDTHICANIHEEIWFKLLGNACFNPICLLAGFPTDELIDDPSLNGLFIKMVDEVLELGKRLNIFPESDSRQRIGITRKLGKVITSMLQDAQGRKPFEVEAILGTLLNVADLADAPIPRVRAVYALTRMRAKMLDLLAERLLD